MKFSFWIRIDLIDKIIQSVDARNPTELLIDDGELFSVAGLLSCWHAWVSQHIWDNGVVEVGKL